MTDSHPNYLARGFDDLDRDVLILDTRGQILEINEQAIREHGWDPSRLKGTSLCNLVSEEARHEFQRQIKRCLEGRSVDPLDVRLMTRNGDKSPVRLALTLFSSASGTPQGIRISMDSLSIDETARERLRENEEYYHAILNASMDAIITFNREGVIVGVNPATERIFGYEHGQMMGQNVRMLMPSPYQEEHDDYLSRYHEMDEVRIIGKGREVVCERKDGSTFPADLTVNEVDHLGIYTGILRDITKRKRAEAELKKEHEFVESLIMTAQVVILLLDANGRVLRFNRFLETLSGWSSEEARGLDWFETFIPEDERDQIREVFERAKSVEPTRGNINSILNRRGERFLIEWHDTVLTSGRGDLSGILCTGTDVTERTRLEKEVSRVAEEEKRRIACELHDGMGAQLSAIGMMARGLSSKLRAGSVVAAEDMDFISEQASEAVVLARSLSRGLRPVGDGPGALVEAFQQFAEQICRTGSQCCEFEAPGDEFVLHDPAVANHLYRIGQEALHNAIRHANSERVCIGLQCQGGEVVLTIQDDGSGFDLSEMRNRDEGFGLRTMEYRAREMGGTLEIESVPGEGTRIVCRVPLKEQATR